MSDQASRLEDLRWALAVTRESIDSVDPEKRSPLIAQFRAILSEIEELDPPTVGQEGKVSGLVILQEELAKRRQSGAAGSRRTGTRDV